MAARMGKPAWRCRNRRGRRRRGGREKLGSVAWLKITCRIGPGPATVRRGRLAAHVHRFTSTAAFLVGVAIAVASCGSGCRLVRQRDPVPADLAAARRLSNEGLSAVDRRDLARAEKLLERAVQSCPVDVDARRHYAEVLWKRGERTAAVMQIAEALKLSPQDAGLCVEGGRMYLELGLFGDADRLSREAVRLAPQSAPAWHLRGQVALARGQPEPALADLHRALAIAPDDRGALLDAAEAYRRLERPQRVLATLAILGDTYGPGQTPAGVLAMEGQAQEALGRTADAAESYRLAIARGDSPGLAAERLAALEQARAH